VHPWCITVKVMWSDIVKLERTPQLQMCSIGSILHKLSELGVKLLYVSDNRYVILEIVCKFLGSALYLLLIIICCVYESFV